MLDIKLIRENPVETEALLKAKDPTVSLKKILSLDEKRRQLQTEGEKLKSRRNQNAKQVGEKKRLGKDASDLLKEMEGVGQQITAIDKSMADVEHSFHAELALLPNLPSSDVKISPDAAQNVCLKTVGQPRSFSFTPKNHLELNDQLQLFDFKRGAKLSGTGWVAYRGLGAQLEWALIRLMLDTHIAAGFEPWIPPFAVRTETVQASAHLPKFADQLYKIPEKDHSLYLIPTAEASLNGLHMNEILTADQLPLRYVAYTPCFRREAGAAGAQERGLIRTHQFNKVELFCLTHPSESEAMLDAMIVQAEKILNLLEIPYRQMLLVTGDMSFSAAKTIDLEAWLPGQERYYEVSSLSNCTDFQARRAHIRLKDGKEKPQFVHTLNGSGLATSRLMVALLETHQQSDGSVLLPEALYPYMAGIKKLEVKKQR
ncbi:MAG: serine--tRNA ligase [Chlamydiota bacterium]